MVGLGTASFTCRCMVCIWMQICVPVYMNVYTHTVHQKDTPHRVMLPHIYSAI